MSGTQVLSKLNGTFFATGTESRIEINNCEKQCKNVGYFGYSKLCFIVEPKTEPTSATSKAILQALELYEQSGVPKSTFLVTLLLLKLRRLCSENSETDFLFLQHGNWNGIEIKQIRKPSVRTVTANADQY